MKTKNKLVEIVAALRHDGPNGFIIEESKETGTFIIMGWKSHFMYGSAETKWEAEMEREKIVQIAESIMEELPVIQAKTAL
jgi:hypothetical protein